MKRREVLHAAVGLAAAGAAAEFGLTGRAAEANDRITIGVMGVRGRGGTLLTSFAAQPDVEVAYVCDVDLTTLDSRAKQVQDATGKRPKTADDYRRVLDDSRVSALVIGAPDHWHALPTIHACQAGKDVYVEKPDGHNILEGHTMVAAARKHRARGPVGHAGPQRDDAAGGDGLDRPRALGQGPFRQGLGEHRPGGDRLSAGQRAAGGRQLRSLAGSGAQASLQSAPLPRFLEVVLRLRHRRLGKRRRAPAGTSPAGPWKPPSPHRRKRSPACRRPYRRTAANTISTTRKNGPTP